MIALLVCSCANSEALARDVLQQAEVDCWLSAPCYTGKDAGYKFLNGFGSCPDADDHREGEARTELKDYLGKVSSYAVILGYDDEHAGWIDIGRGDVRSRLKALALAKTFA